MTKLQVKNMAKPMVDVKDETNEDEEKKGIIRVHTEFGTGFIVYSSKEDREEAMKFLDSLKAGENAVVKKEGK